jgi:hypothetical protein
MLKKTKNWGKKKKKKYEEWIIGPKEHFSLVLGSIKTHA